MTIEDLARIADKPTDPDHGVEWLDGPRLVRFRLTVPSLGIKDQSVIARPTGLGAWKGRLRKASNGSHSNGS